MQNVVVDAETDGLLDQLTKVHCLVLRCLDTNLVVSCTDSAPEVNASKVVKPYHSIAYGLSLLSKAERVFGHNILNFDIPALQKVYPDFKLSGRLYDTLVMARYRFAHIKELDYETYEQNGLPGQMLGAQSLEAWGYRLGKKKTEYKAWCKANGIEDPFKEWRPEMQSYCEDDTDTSRDLVLKLRKAGALPEEATETEHELARYLHLQEENGWPFDMDAAVSLQAKLSARREELGNSLKAHFGSWTVPGKTFIPKRDDKKRGYVKGVPVQKTRVIEFNPGSRDHIAHCLKTQYGWVPTSFTETGKAQVDEGMLDGLDFPAVKDLKEYLLVDKRLGQLAEGKKAWLTQVQNDRPHGGALTGMQHIHHDAHQTCVTHRHRHARPNIAQVPKVGTEYGAECRALFTVPRGWVQIGADAAGLELRCLAHYLARFDGGAYGKTVVEGKQSEGTDVHTVNMRALSEFLPQDKEGRDKAKTFIYAYLYGAGDQKLGSIVAPGASPAKQKKIGKKLRTAFESNLAAMGYLVNGVKAKAQQKKYLVTLDGRRVYVRHQHAALNTLLQCAGAIICKRWIVHFDRTLTAKYGQQGWRGKWAALGWIHDEVQLAVHPEIAEDVCSVLVQEIRGITDHYGFRVPLDGEAKIGSNWRDTH